MAKNYETVIGLEVHVELATKTKIFCGCSCEFGGSPNTRICPVCLGMPHLTPKRQITGHSLRQVASATAEQCVGVARCSTNVRGSRPTWDCTRSLRIHSSDNASRDVL